MGINHNKDYFIINNKPTFIYSANFNYTRTPRSDWRNKLLKIKAAGLNTVATYAVWGFHETEKGMWNFDGDRDLAHFIDLTNELGLYFIFRIGPFVHSEWKHGGLPSWLIEEMGNKARCNDPKYLNYAKKWYEKCLNIAKDRTINNGGNIIMLQAENEFGSAGSKGNDIHRGDDSPSEGKKHIMFFLDIIKDAKIDLPMINFNHFEGRDEIDYLIDGGGIYVVNCFGVNGEFPEPDYKLWKKHTAPLMSIETGSGMFLRFFDWPSYSLSNSYQAPIVKPEYIDRTILQQIGTGFNTINLFEMVDGQHIEDYGEAMLPEKEFNFQAPITTVGSLRESYEAIKRAGWFIRSFEEKLLESKPFESWISATSHGQKMPGENETLDLLESYSKFDATNLIYNNDTKVSSIGRACKGLNLSESNFAFLFNTYTGKFGWKRDIRITTNCQGIPCEVTNDYPHKVQLTMPPQTNRIIPFFIKLDENKFLEYSTAQPLDLRDFANGKQIILHGEYDETLETRVLLPKVCNVKNYGSGMQIWDSPCASTILATPESKYQISIYESDKPLRVIHLNKDLAGKVWDISSNCGNYVAISDAYILETKSNENKTNIKAEVFGEDFYIDMFCDKKPNISCNNLKVKEKYNEEFGIYEAFCNLITNDYNLKFKKEIINKDAIYTANINDDVFENIDKIVLKININGEFAKAYIDNELISEHFYGKYLYWETEIKKSSGKEIKIHITNGTSAQIEQIKVKDLDIEMTFND